MGTELAVKADDRQDAINQGIDIGLGILQGCNRQDTPYFTFSKRNCMCSPEYFIPEKVPFGTFLVLPPRIPVTPAMPIKVTLAVIHIQANYYRWLFVSNPLEVGMFEAGTRRRKIIPVDAGINPCTGQ